MPVPSATSPDPKPWKMLWMSDTAIPLRSTTHRYTVSPPPGESASGVHARSGSIRWRSSAAYSFAINRSIGMGTRSGSVM